MNRPSVAIFAVSLLVAGGSLPGMINAWAGERSPIRDGAVIEYRPPVRGAPASRVGGAVRGLGKGLPELVALVPDHTGFTSLEQPSLYWFISKPIRAQIEVVLLDEDPLAVEPVLESRLDLADGGFHRVSLRDHGARLKRGVEYEWSVTLVVDPENRSSDIISGGTIERVEPADAMQQALAGVDQADLAQFFAREGFWYDAVAALSERIAADPGNVNLQKQRAALLKQVGLTRAAIEGGTL